MSDFVFSEQQDSFGFSDAHDDFDWKETAKGDPGAVFTPDVSEQGIISWTNNGGLPNPQPRNIRGPKGDSLDLPQGGLTSQILKKASDEDYDVEWADAAEAQVQSDWTETDTDEPSYIQHKPDLSHFIDDSDYAPTAKTQDMIQPVGVDANGALWTAPGGDASSDMIADEYDAEKVDGYAVGDYCYRDGTLYRCKTEIPAGGETWNPAHWDECTVTGEIQTLQEDFSEFDEMSGIAVQDTAPSGRIKMWLDTDGNPIVLPEIDDEHTNLVDTWSSQKISDSIGAVDDSLANVQSGLAIIVDGDTCITAVPVGGYAYITNNTHGLAEGLYTNSSASAFPTTGGTADGTVFTAVSSGGFNDFKNYWNNFLKITELSKTRTANNYQDNEGFNRWHVYKKAGYYWFHGNFAIASMGHQSPDLEIGRINNYHAYSAVYLSLASQDNNSVLFMGITADGVITINCPSGKTASGFYRFAICVPCENAYDFA